MTAGRTQSRYRPSIVCLSPFLGLAPVVLHGAGQQPPQVPHWMVLLVAVPALWLVVGGAVVGIDRLLDRLEA